MNDEERKAEKERLMKEVLNKDRTRLSNDYSDENVELSLNASEKTDTKKTGSVMDSALNASNDLLKHADASFKELKKLLNNQQKDLESMSKDNGFNAEDMERVQKEIERDYGVTKEEAESQMVVTNLDTAKVFEQAKDDMDAAIVGQNEAIDKMCIAFRRPMVMGTEEGKAKNVILITGPNGSGRHLLVSAIAESLYKQRAISSKEVYTVDMSLYQSASQEQIFLQDLYKDLSGKGEILCFENFEVGAHSFLLMINDLVCKGSTTLNKRYVLNKGILVENQTGLVKDNAVSSLSAEGKYLVFITDGGTKAIQNAFGAEFLYHVLDIVETTRFSEEDGREYIELQTKALQEKAASQLKLQLTLEDSLKEWVLKNYDKNSGSDALNKIFYDFYVLLSEQVLNHVYEKGSVAVFTVGQDGQPVGKIKEDTFTLLRSKTSSEEVAAVNKELDEIVGLTDIKEYIHSLQSHIKVQEIRKAQGMKASEISKHMIFTGNPGTGKTTIARLISRYMKAIGALSLGQLVEVTRADLVAQYVGQTAPLTMSVVKSALGGVLFIDEAYSLYRGKDDSFGLECIDTIVKAMEDNRDNLIVILAGYEREMSEFLEANSGLKSRFPNIIHFPDYTGEELCRIACIQAESKGYRIEETALPRLTEYFTTVQNTNAAEAGNGRLARNLVEEAILHQANRIVSNPEASIDELKESDFDFTVKVKAQDDMSELRAFNEMLKNAE